MCIRDSFNTSCATTIAIVNNDGNTESTIQYSPTGVDIRSISDEGKESTATIDNNGLSFSSHDSAVMLGNTSQFRIKYDETSDTVQIQYFDGQNYITKAEYSR